MIRMRDLSEEMLIFSIHLLYLWFMKYDGVYSFKDLKERLFFVENCFIPL